MGYDLKSIREEFKKNGVFYTPIELGEYVKTYIDIDYDEVYDPTCGRGNLLCIFDDKIKKYGQELDEIELKKAKELLVNFEGYCGDTIFDDKFKNRKFKLIMANPPFSVKYEDKAELLEDERFKDCGILAPASKADWMFNLHILSKLEDDGIALVINFPGILYRGNREKEIRKWIVEQNYIDSVIEIGKDKFVDTPVSTALMIYRKNKKNTNINFINSDGIKEVVGIERIREENYNLTVSRYVYIEQEKEEINIDKLNADCFDFTLKKIDTELKLNLFLKLELGANINFKKMLNDMKKIIKKYEEKYNRSILTEEEKTEIEQMLLFNS